MEDNKKLAQDEVFSEEVSLGFRRFKFVRFVFTVIGRSSPIIFGFACGLTLWVLSIAILWLNGSGYEVLGKSFVLHVPYFCAGIFLFLLFSAFIGYINLKRQRIDLKHYIHWCDVERKYDSELLTAFERACSGSKLTSFDEFIENNAKAKIARKGVPKSYNNSDVKRAYRFAGLITYIVLLFVVIAGINNVVNPTNTEIAFDDETNARNKANASNIDTDKKLEKLKKDDEKAEKDAEKDAIAENVNTQAEKEKTPNEDEKHDKKEGEGDNEDADSNKNEASEMNEKKEKPDPETELENENENMGEKDKNSQENKDKAKFELDPLKTAPEASEGATKTKKEKVYHIDRKNEADGSLIDAEKLLDRLKSSENKDKSLPLSMKEKKLIEKYRKMLEKILSSR
ncbi:MAG: hypothetical protein K8S87_07525 [Planctomycetes bacterium]|nr:hypothetical protein [Planctomycetota bacterium]